MRSLKLRVAPRLAAWLFVGFGWTLILPGAVAAGAAAYLSSQGPVAGAEAATAYAQSAPLEETRQRSAAILAEMEDEERRLLRERLDRRETREHLMVAAIARYHRRSLPKKRCRWGRF